MMPEKHVRNISMLFLEYGSLKVHSLTSNMISQWDDGFN